VAGGGLLGLRGAAEGGESEGDTGAGEHAIRHGFRKTARL